MTIEHLALIVLQWGLSAVSLVVSVLAIRLASRLPSLPARLVADVQSCGHEVAELSYSLKRHINADNVRIRHARNAAAAAAIVTEVPAPGPVAAPPRQFTFADAARLNALLKQNPALRKSAEAVLEGGQPVESTGTEG